MDRFAYNFSALVANAMWVGRESIVQNVQLIALHLHHMNFAAMVCACIQMIQIRIDVYAIKVGPTMALHSLALLMSTNARLQIHIVQWIQRFRA